MLASCFAITLLRKQLVSSCSTFPTRPFSASSSAIFWRQLFAARKIFLWSSVLAKLSTTFKFPGAVNIVPAFRSAARTSREQKRSICSAKLLQCCSTTRTGHFIRGQQKICFLEGGLILEIACGSFGKIANRIWSHNPAENRAGKYPFSSTYISVFRTIWRKRIVRSLKSTFVDVIYIVWIRHDAKIFLVKYFIEFLEKTWTIQIIESIHRCLAHNMQFLKAQ